MFFPKWFNSGITFVSDILDDQGVILEQHQIEQKFRLNINFLEYYRIKYGVELFLRNHSNLSGALDLLNQPFIPAHIAFVFNNKKGTKGYMKN